MIGGRLYADDTTLIKGGYVLTLDPELGDMPHTDVLIQGSKIVAIGQDLQASPNANVIDARHRIVMPGFVDTHRHTWQTPVRGVLPNPDRTLLPGFFVRVRVPIDREKNGLFVPDVALGADQAGRYLLVVNGENVVEQRKVETGPTVGEMIVIENGLKPEDRVVTAGVLRAIPGQKVDPKTQTAAAK